MQPLLFLVMLLLPICSFSQNTTNVESMKKLGYEIVDLKLINNKANTPRPCSTCPSSSAKASSSSPINAAQEIQQLELSILQLQKVQKALLQNPPVDTVLLHKYQKAQLDSSTRIELLKKKH